MSPRCNLYHGSSLQVVNYNNLLYLLMYPHNSHPPLPVCSVWICGFRNSPISDGRLKLIPVTQPWLEVESSETTGSYLHSGLLLLFSGQFGISFPSTLSGRQHYLLPDLPRASYPSISPALAPHSALRVGMQSAQCSILHLPSLCSSGDTSGPRGVYDISLDCQDRNTEAARYSQLLGTLGQTHCLNPWDWGQPGQYNESSTQKWTNRKVCSETLYKT